ncbi:MAG: protein kinase [Chloroflexi bacterium]|nr:protein kinase [Chloroflexota bacterium]
MRSRAALVVGDRPTARVVLAALLRRRGWRVLTARSGTEARALLRVERPAIVVVHLSPPDDAEVVRLLRAQPATARAPVVAIVRDAVARDGVLAAGATACSVEPIDGAQLLDQVATLLHPSADRPAIPLPAGAEPSPAAAPALALPGPGDVLLGYLVRRELGRGGYGVVYEAWDAPLDRAVALKVLYPDHTASSDDMARFRQEARVLAHLQHPNVVAIYRLGDERGLTVVALEYVSGGSLRDLVRSQTPLPVARVLALADGICAGLTAVHALGVIHRDLKPENILLTAEGTPKIGDFGIAHVPRTVGGLAGTTPGGVTIGTWHYMAPEQASGQPVDLRADIFALGALLYECLTGRSHLGPAAHGSLEVLLHALRTRPADAPSAWNAAVSRALDRLVLRALAKEPKERWATAAHLRAALRAVARPQQLSTRETPAAEPAPDT